MILDELEQERCSKNRIKINTKCTFGWPGLAEDPGGTGGGGVTPRHGCPSLQCRPLLCLFCIWFLPNLHFLLVVIARTELFTKEMKTFSFSSVAYALYSIDMLHVFFSDIV